MDARRMPILLSHYSESYLEDSGSCLHPATHLDLQTCLFFVSPPQTWPVVHNPWANTHIPAPSLLISFTSVIFHCLRRSNLYIRNYLSYVDAAYGCVLHWPSYA